MQAASLSVRHLEFSYGSHAALSGITLDIQAPLTCILGPNGAGKSTLLSLLTGRLLPKSGSLHLGKMPLTRRTRRSWAARTGWAPQDVPIVPGMTATEQVAYVSWLHGLSRINAREAASPALDAVGLSRAGSKRVSALSGGQRRRVGIAAAIAHRPQFAFLDEPTAGLDAEQRDHFRTLLPRIAEHSRLVVSTHQTEDAHQLYDSVIVIDRGQAIFSGTLDDLIHCSHENAIGSPSVDKAYISLVRREKTS